MQRLLDFLKKYSYWFLFLLLEGLSLLLLFRFNSYQKSVWVTSANAVSGKILEWKSDFSKYISLIDINQQLTQKNILLEHRVQQLTEELRKKEVDNLSVALSDSIKGYELMAAKVVESSLFKKNNYITINKGENDGVECEMGVVCGTGVVGIVYATSPHYAIVMPLLNGKSNISCQIRGTDYFGYLRWNGEHPKYASMEDVPRHAKIENGMEVETSGFSAVFPEGIKVGEVVRTEGSADGLSYCLQVNLSTDFASLRDVYVLKSTSHAEIKQLHQGIIKEK